METDNVSLQLYNLYDSNKELKKSVDNINDLAGVVSMIDISSVELSNASTLEAANSAISKMATNIESVQENIQVTIDILKENVEGVKELFNYFLEQDSELSSEALEMFKSISEMQNDAFAEVDYYDQYIEEKSPRLAELHKQIDELESQKNNLTPSRMSTQDAIAYKERQEAIGAQLNELTEEYATLLQDLMLMKQLRNFAFENAYSMYAQYDDFEKSITTWNKTYEDGSLPTTSETALACEIYFEYPYEIPDIIIQSSNDSKVREYKDNVLNYLTEDEKNIIIYLYNTGNQKRLDDYLKYMEDKANQRHGEDLAKSITDTIDGYYAAIGTSVYDEVGGVYNTVTEANAFANTIAELGFVGFGDGVKTFFNGLDNLIDADGKTSAEEYKTQYLIQYLQDKYGEEGFKRILATGSYEISSSIGNMVPSIVVSAIPGCQWAGLTLMGLSATGNAREQALQQGLDEGGAWLYGILSGLSEAGLEYVLGGITKLAGGKTSEAITKGLGIPKLFAEMLSEGNEESLQSILDPLFLTIASRGEIPYEVDWNEVLKSGIYGMITAGIMNTAGAGIEFVLNDTTYSITNEQAEKLIEEFKGQDLTKSEVKATLLERIKKSDAKVIIDVSYREIERFFSLFDDFGADQGFLTRQVFSDMIYNQMSLGTPEFKRLKKKLMQQGFTEYSAEMIIKGLDSKGACSYAAIANGIFATYRNNPSAFEKTFGYSMYTTNSKGKTILNTGELLLDMYTYMNNEAHGGSMFRNNSNGTISVISISNERDVFNRPKMDAKNQQYLSYRGYGINSTAIESFLKSKKDYLSLNTNSIIQYGQRITTNNQMNTLAHTVMAELEHGNNVQLDIWDNKGKAIVMHPMTPGAPSDTTAVWEGGGHAVAVVGVTNYGFVVSSWGYKYLITYSDLMKKKFQINSWNIINH